MESRYQVEDKAPAGVSRFRFAKWDGPEIDVWVFRPDEVGPDTRVLFVMHGVERDARRYLEEWQDLARDGAFILVAPEFDSKRFQGAQAYNQGNVSKGVQSASAFAAIEPLFDDIRHRTGTRVSGYYLYGHSAGAQFVHRFVMLMPKARLNAAVAANAGWYTIPNRSENYPAGLRDAPFSSPKLQAVFARSLTILLGTADSDPLASNLKSDRLTQRQGKNRLLRGQFFFDESSKLAARAGGVFNWRIEYAPGVGHENAAIAPHASRALFDGSVRETPSGGRIFFVPADGKTDCNSAPGSFHVIGHPCDQSGLILAVETAAATRFTKLELTDDDDLFRLDTASCRPGTRNNLAPSTITIGTLDALNGKVSSRELSAQIRNLVRQDASVVFVRNSVTAGRIERSGDAWIVHISGASKRSGSSGATARRRIEMTLVAAISRTGERDGALLQLYPASPGSSRSLRLQSTTPRDMQRFADAAAHISLQTERDIALFGGRDEHGGFVAAQLDGVKCQPRD